VLYSYFSSLWRRLRNVWCELGPRGVWFGVLAHTIYRRLALLERQLEGALPDYRPRVEAEIRCLGPADELAYYALRPRDDASLFRRRLDRADQCWGAWCEGELRHVGWIATKEAWIRHLDRSFRLAEEEAFTYGAFTHPDWRGLGLQPARQAVCLRALHDRGYRRAFCTVLPESRAAFSSLSKVGYQRIGVIGYVGLGRWRWSFYRAAAGGKPPAGLR
jgi:GNAT superfamily N-acetyltransferase